MGLVFCSGFRGLGGGFRVWCLGFWGLGFEVLGFGFWRGGVGGD